ncbi:hypothetical protein H634G_04146 [Metarhizium anisopliae BRIP 53293]|uniref:Zn(2)-C6 fungal-type domain-containing protein n=1 Tax=Metarhizium anisopliae BRIP 53293 TaxID=1291518 RepID=A0A0D9P0T4_METAN|nr:hypothetical protein H634G_04146 [Metarhizium anisopliae BRIP 53293]KJK95910.1 hypothetical protein H633G_00259 [Metarhizium anisopliae BRIP 53284]
MPAPPDQRTASWQVHTSSPAETSSGSRGGPCHTCRRQRLRCDATKPSCNKCLARGVECLGYGPRAILWVQPKWPAQVGKSTDESTKEPESMAATGKKKGRPRLVLMPKNTRESPAQSEPQARHESEWVFVNHADYPDGRRALVKKQAVSSGLVPAGYHNNMLALSMLDYMNKHIVSDMVLFDNEVNPHRVELEYWRYFPDVIIDMVISCCLTHQVIRCHATQDSFPQTSSNVRSQLVHVTKHRISSFQNPSVGVIFKHHLRTLRQLGEDLKDQELRYSDVVLAAIITLVRVEIQQSAFGAWPAHLDAARAIIAQRGGFQTFLPENNANIGEGLATFVFVDVLGAIFTPSNMLNSRDTLAQLEYVPFLDTICRDGANSDFPCANRLLECIIRINQIRFLGQGVEAQGSDLDAACSQIFHRIASFDAAAWAQSRLLELGSSSPPSWSPEIRDTRQNGAIAVPRATIQAMTEDLARAFQYAVMLYCVRTLYMDRGKSVPDSLASLVAAPLQSKQQFPLDVENLHQSALHGLLQALHRLWAMEKSSGPAWVGKFSFWPIWVAGMELDPRVGTSHEQAFICASLQRLCYYLGALGPLDAVSALQAVWAKTAFEAGAGQHETWDRRLMVPGLRYMFCF